MGWKTTESVQKLYEPIKEEREPAKIALNQHEYNLIEPDKTPQNQPRSRVNWVKHYWSGHKIHITGP
jgi:hypothetical protein